MNELSTTALNRGIAAAIRKRVHFDTLEEIVEVMNPIVWDLYPTEKRTSTAFFDRLFGSTIIGRNFERLRTMYEKGFLPIRGVASGGGDDLSTEVVEGQQLAAAIDAVFPSPHPANEELSSFVKFFESRPAAAVDTDFYECRASLEVQCLRVGEQRSSKDQIEYEKSPRDSFQTREERINRIKAVFARDTSLFLSSVSDEFSARLFDPEGIKRVPFFAGASHDSLDALLGGFHGAGLVTFLGGTSGGKTLTMSSLIANHCLSAYKAGNPQPTIWGYIGEDSAESYAQRILVNLLNRPEMIDALGLGPFTIGDWPAMCQDQGFVAASKEILSSMLGGCFWLRSPERIADKINFSTETMLEAFDAKLDNNEPPPAFIVVDYFNLLKLSRRNSTSNRPFDLQQISHYLDEWGSKRNIPIVTAVQASIGGIVGARDLRFYEQEDLHESKSIAHNSRMVISLMPFKQYSRDGNFQDWMGIKILKNRGGPRDMVFISDLDYGKNITFGETRYMTDVEWNDYKNELISVRAEVLSENRGGEGTSQSSTGRGYRRQNSDQDTSGQRTGQRSDIKPREV